MKIKILSILCISIAIITCFIYFISNEKNEEEKEPIATVKNAYCNNGSFIFTLENLVNGTITIDYKWTLNDPGCDVLVFEGEGEEILVGQEQIEIIIPVENGSFDARFYVMHIDLYENGKVIYNYREQKSTYDWDYSILPPVKNGHEGEYVPEYVYKLDFYPNVKDNFSIVIPFLILNDTPNDIILEELKNLNVSFSIEQTQYGIGLNISSHNNVSIYIQGTTDCNMFNYEFSLQNDTGVEYLTNYMVYSTTNGSFDYEFGFENETLEYGFHIIDDIEQGWQSPIGKFVQIFKQDQSPDLD